MPTEHAIKLAEIANNMLEIGAKHTQLAGDDVEYLDYVMAVYDFSRLVTDIAAAAQHGVEKEKIEDIYGKLCDGLLKCFPSYQNISVDVIAYGAQWIHLYGQRDLTAEEDNYLIDQMKLCSGRLLQKYPGHAAVTAYNQARAEA